jgi:hypothetical protein
MSCLSVHAAAVLLQAVAVKDLPLASDASKLQLAFALWAEGLAATVPSGQQRQQPKEAAGSKQKQQGDKKGKRPADAAAAAAGEETATSSGKAKPSKKAKV